MNQSDMGNQKKKGYKTLVSTPYLCMYEIEALTRFDKPFSYYFASRDNEEKIKLNTHSHKATGMAIFAITDERQRRLVMVRQYRYPVDEYIYELPAGLIEDGESAEDAAVREMREETGLTLEIYRGGMLGIRRPFYLAQGFSDELDSMVFGIASGDTSCKDMEDSEDIEVVYVDKEEAKRILNEERLSVRAGYMLLNFIHMNDDEPFAFLDA